MVKAIRQACLRVFWAFLRLTARKPKARWVKSKKGNDLDFA
jgi:hypothetical protein